MTESITINKPINISDMNDRLLKIIEMQNIDGSWTYCKELLFLLRKTDQEVEKIRPKEIND